MKQLLKKSLVVLIILTTMVSYANEIKLHKNVNTDKVTNVTFENAQAGSLLLIKDVDGVILFSEQINQSGLITKGFDLTNLPDADYYFELSADNEIIIIPFSVKDNFAKLIQNEAYKIVKPEIFEENGYVHISNQSTIKQALSIDVYYEGYDLAYSENLKNDETINRIYDFSSSKKGNYVFVFTIEGRVFRNSINI